MNIMSRKVVHPFLALLLPLALLGAFAVSSAQAVEVIQFDINTDRPSYIVGDTVNWSIDVSILNSTAENFGIAIMSLDVDDVLGEVLTGGTVPTDGPFGSYSFSSGGDPEQGGLLSIGALLVQQDASVTIPGVGQFSFVRGADDANASAPSNIRENLRLAEGSFVTTIVGQNMLVGVDPQFGTATPANTRFSAAGQVGGAGPEYTNVLFNNASFTVTAIPEPGSLALLSMGAVFLLRRRRRLPKALP